MDCGTAWAISWRSGPQLQHIVVYGENALLARAISAWRRLTKNAGCFYFCPCYIDRFVLPLVYDVLYHLIITLLIQPQAQTQTPTHHCPTATATANKLTLRSASGSWSSRSGVWAKKSTRSRMSATPWLGSYRTPGTSTGTGRSTMTCNTRGGDMRWDLGEEQGM